MKKITINLEWLEKNGKSFTDYCRYLVSEGISDGYRLEAYRGETLCLYTNDIGKAAKLTIRENSKVGPIFVKYKPLDEKAKERFAKNRQQKH